MSAVSECAERTKDPQRRLFRSKRHDEYLCARQRTDAAARAVRPPNGPCPARVTVLFDTTDNASSTVGRHRYRGDGVEISYFFGIDALDTLADFDAAYRFMTPSGIRIEFDQSDVAATLCVLDLEALGAPAPRRGRETSQVPEAASHKAP